MNLQIRNLKSAFLNPSTPADKKSAALVEIRALAETNPEARSVVEEIEAEQLKKVSLLIATPAYGGNITTDCCLSIIKLMAKLRDLEIPHDLRFITNHSLVTRARNEIANHFFLNTKHSHLLQVDSDNSFDPADIVRAIAADLDFVGLPYSRKMLHWPRIEQAVKAGVTSKDLPRVCAADPVVNPLKYGCPVHVRQDGLFEARRCGTGILLTKRTVFEQLVQANPELKYSLYEEEKQNCFRDFAYAFFHEARDEQNRMLSEDFAFCDSWRKIGGKVYVASFAKTSHFGSFEFRFDGSPIYSSAAG